MSFGRKNLAGGLIFSSTGGKSDLDLKTKITGSGWLPPELLGITQHSGSIFSNIAHREEQNKRFNNLVNNGVDNEIYFSVNDKGGAPVRTPFSFNGNVYYPDKDGKVRIANNSNVELAKQIRRAQEAKCDKIMEDLILGDDIAAYVLGLTYTQWKNLCQAGSDDTIVWEDPDVARIDCRIEKIESLVDGSIQQTQALGKLRKICKYYMHNVNLEDFDSVGERKSDMSKGTNNPNVGDQSHALLTTAEEAAAAAKAEKV